MDGLEMLMGFGIMSSKGAVIKVKTKSTNYAEI